MAESELDNKAELFLAHVGETSPRFCSPGTNDSGETSGSWFIKSPAGARDFFTSGRTGWHVVDTAGFGKVPEVGDRLFRCGSFLVCNNDYHRSKLGYVDEVRPFEERKAETVSAVKTRRA